MNNNIIHDDALVIHLTVGQIKAIVAGAFQEASLLFSKSLQTETLTIEEVSELTGYKRATIYRFTHERKIPFHKPAHGGRRIFFKRSEINEWLESNCMETYEESFKKQEKQNASLKQRKINEYGKSSYN